MKMPPMKAPKPTALPKTGNGKPAKPHIRMRKLKPVPPGAFPQAPQAFPQGQGPMDDPGGAMSALPGGMPTGAAPGDMGE